MADSVDTAAGYYDEYGIYHMPVDPNKEDKAVYSLGGDNTDYYNQSEADPTAWIDNLKRTILSELVNAAQEAGHDKQYGTMIFERYWSTFLQQADKELFQGKPESSLGQMMWLGSQLPEGTGTIQSPANYLSGGGWTRLVSYARSWYQTKAPELANTWEIGIGNKKSGGGGGGGGSAMNLVDQFDVSQLAARAQNLYRGLLMDDLQNPRELAQQYVDRVVATGGTKNIDFDTFVKDSIHKTPRYAAIYRAKPPGLTDEQFFQPYVQSAMQVMGGSQDVGNVAAGGAMLGASTSAFQSRLQRTDAVKTSAPFIQGLEARLGDLKKVFRQ